jgi:hypothetical protein
MNYIMSLGGKRVRPLLAIIGNQLSNGNIQNGIYVGHVMEVFHNFSLVHDDIMDGAATRRGLPTAAAKWGHSLSVLLGDALFASSMGGGAVSFPDALATNRKEIFSLPDETVIAPGHGPLTSVGEEKAHNPFYPEFK